MRRFFQPYSRFRRDLLIIDHLLNIWLVKILTKNVSRVGFPVIAARVELSTSPNGDFLSRRPDIKATPVNMRVIAQPVELGVQQPLEGFFSRYSKFRYQPESPPTTEFNRLCEQYRWEKNSSKKKAALCEFNLAMKKEFDSLYGSDEKDINNWYKLCHVLRIDPVPNTLKECRRVSTSLRGPLNFSFLFQGCI